MKWGSQLGNTFDNHACIGGYVITEYFGYRYRIRIDIIIPC